MPTPAKTLDNMSKHLTREEREQREKAESTTLSARGKPKTARKIITRDPAARKYWDGIWRQMEVHKILDHVDEYEVASFCSLLAMRDRLSALTPMLLDQLENMEDWVQDPDAVRELASAFKSCAALSSSRLKIESQLLQLADKLGLTPTSRSRLAIHYQAEEPVDPDGDLFG